MIIYITYPKIIGECLLHINIDILNFSKTIINVLSCEYLLSIWQYMIKNSWSSDLIETWKNIYILAKILYMCFVSCYRLLNWGLLEIRRAVIM